LSDIHNFFHNINDTYGTYLVFKELFNFAPDSKCVLTLPEKSYNQQNIALLSKAVISLTSNRNKNCSLKLH